MTTTATIKTLRVERQSTGVNGFLFGTALFSHLPAEILNPTARGQAGFEAEQFKVGYELQLNNAQAERLESWLKTQTFNE